MNTIKNSFAVIDDLAGRLRWPAKQKHTIHGLCGEGCIPFIQVQLGRPARETQEVDVVVWNSIWNTMFSSVVSAVPLGSELMAVFTLIDKITGIGAKMYAQDRAKIMQAFIQNAQSKLKIYLECRIDYCTIADWLSGWSNLVLAQLDSAVRAAYAEKVTTIGNDLIRYFILTTQAYNKLRIQERYHIQKITGVTVIRPEDYEGFFDDYVTPGQMMVQVPHIEWYWMGDKIKINSREFTITTRAGQIANPNSNNAADLTAMRGCCPDIDPRIIGNRGEGKYSPGGYNIRNMTGQGWLFINATQTELGGAKAGDTVSLSDKFISDSTATGQDQTSNTINESTSTGTKNAFFADISAFVNKLGINKAGIFSTKTLGTLLFAGVALGLLNQAFFTESEPEQIEKKNQEEYEDEEES